MKIKPRWHTCIVFLPPRCSFTSFHWRYTQCKGLRYTASPRITVLFVNTLRPRRNEQYFADDIFKRIFFNENVWISIEISLKFVHKGPINNIPALVQIMAWRRSGDKSLSEPMMVSLPTHICVTRPQWVKAKCRQRMYHFTERRKQNKQCNGFLVCF